MDFRRDCEYEDFHIDYCVKSYEERQNPHHCLCRKRFCWEHYVQHIDDCPSRKNIDMTKVQLCRTLGCNVEDLQPLICEKCNKHFCIEKNHINMHECIPIESTTKDNENKTEVENKRPTDWVDRLMKKISNYRLVQIAVGQQSIPAKERVYFYIHYSDVMHPVFISRSWSLGRSIDVIVDELKIKNTSTTLKPRLFKLVSREIIVGSVDDIISNLLVDKHLRQCENLILEYVDEDCTEYDVTSSLHLQFGAKLFPW